MTSSCNIDGQTIFTLRSSVYFIPKILQWTEQTSRVTFTPLSKFAEILFGNRKQLALILFESTASDTLARSPNKVLTKIWMLLDIIDKELCTCHCKPPPQPRENMGHGWGFVGSLTLCLARGGGGLVLFFLRCLPREVGD